MAIIHIWKGIWMCNTATLSVKDTNVIVDRGLGVGQGQDTGIYQVTSPLWILPRPTPDTLSCRLIPLIFPFLLYTGDGAGTPPATLHCTAVVYSYDIDVCT